MSPVATAPAHLRSRDAELRAAYLREVLGVLYPPPCRTDGTGTPVASYVVVPDARRPRLLVPARSRRIAAAAVRRYGEPQSRVGKLKRDAVVTALRSGASGMLLRDRIRVYGDVADTVDGYLRRELGGDLSVSIHIGPARANRKPVLQIIAPDGHTAGFAKLGTGPLTRRLVRAETAALNALSHAVLKSVTVPSVAHSGQWNGHQILVQSALPVWRPRAPLTAERLARGMREVAGCCGISRGWLATSPYWAELRERLAAVADREDGIALNAAARTLADRAGDTELRYGAWHGDWAPWNMAVLADTLLVWDWERFTLGVPMGFDALHHELQRRIQVDPDAAGAVERTVTRAPVLLAPFDVPAEVAELTALLYLVDLATRYLADRQAEAGARLGVLGTWLLPVLVRRVEAYAK
jgi:Phosphotransferase enzyme family